MTQWCNYEWEVKTGHHGPGPMGIGNDWAAANVKFANGKVELTVNRKPHETWKCAEISTPKFDSNGVLQEFGTALDDKVEVRTWDTTAELRYLVLPERPAGTEKLSEDELAALVTRDSMIGVTKVNPPAA